MPLPLRGEGDRYMEVHRLQAEFDRDRERERASREERKASRRRPDTTPPAPINRNSAPPPPAADRAERVERAERDVFSPPGAAPRVPPPANHNLRSPPMPSPRTHHSTAHAVEAVRMPNPREAVRDEEPPTTASTPTSSGRDVLREMGFCTPAAASTPRRQPERDLLSPKEVKKRETIERLHALQALEERRRYEELERRLRALEGGGSPRQGGAVEKRVRSLEEELSQTQTDVSLLAAETHSLRALVERQSQEIAQLTAQRDALRRDSLRRHSPLPEVDGGHVLPPPRCPSLPLPDMTPDRNDPDWLEKWQRSVNSSHPGAQVY